MRSGYGQADVTNFAKVLTGWTWTNPEDPVHGGEFVFNKRLHEPGEQTILGRRYADSGIDQGRSVLADLARHPATAQHIAEKLARHFIADEPPPILVAKLAKIGIVPGQDFDASKLDSAVSAGLAKAPKLGQNKINAWKKEGVRAGDLKFKNGWAYTTKAGTYVTDYRQRAFVTAIGLGANLPEDAVYPSSEGPDAVQKYSGAKKYLMHFDKGELPPVRGFWSLTMYNGDYFFVDNPLNRYTLSPRDPLKTNPDGSTDLYIQADSPGADKESNWLPAPKDTFILMLRLYWPKSTPPSILDGSWHIPQVKEVT